MFHVQLPTVKEMSYPLMYTMYKYQQVYDSYLTIDDACIEISESLNFQEEVEREVFLKDGRDLWKARVLKTFKELIKNDLADSMDNYEFFLTEKGWKKFGATFPNQD
ncbi:hypothetical protein [Planococcus sp. CAU13]|uniref:hypothetical protein n=1 Tax=Planococcus sp. CAU13 TaxID=1541197 RepID=UPI00053004D7|nr:hypothetical protein [Planococcus sp. CAU13]